MRSFITCLIPVILHAPSVFAQVWSECEGPLLPRWYPGSAVVDGRIYLIGGQDSIPPFSSTAEVEVYDALTDAWSPVSPMNHPRWGMMTAVVDGRIYAIGGQTGSFLDGYVSTDFAEVYDPGSNSWSDLAPMPTPRGWGGCAVWNGVIYVFGGYDPEVESTGMEVEKYDPLSDSWSADPPMDDFRETFSCIGTNDGIYLIGGWGSDLVQIYDPELKIWTGLEPMPTARGGAGVSSYGDYIIVCGGRGGAEAVEAYRVPTDSWIELPSLGTPREGLVTEIVNGILYAVTGSKQVDQGGLPYYGITERLAVREMLSE